MSTREEISQIIERYLDGDMDAAERKAIDARLQSDEDFVRAFEFHLQMRRTFTWKVEQDVLRGQMTKFHSEFEAKPSVRKKSSLSSFARNLMAAASVSLLISAASLTAYYFITHENKKSSNYKFLNRTAAAEPKKAVEAVPVAENEEVIQQNIATGFIISEDGYMLTNYHVVEGKKFVYVEKFQDSLHRYVAKVIEVDKKLDIALLQINDPAFTSAGAIPFTFASSDAMIGQKVFTLGYPKNDVVYSEGPISSLTGYQSDTIALQLSLPVNPGNSGAPVFTENGELIGVITGKNAEADGEAYGVKVDLVNRFIHEVNDSTLIIPKKNLLKNKKVTDQVKLLQPFIYLIKA